jgi:hypothetical protein
MKSMQTLSTPELAEAFRKRLVVLPERLEILKKPREPPEAPATGLLRLPAEIRLQIYHHCIPRKRIIEVNRPRFDPQWLFMDDGHDQTEREFNQDLEEDDDVYDFEGADVNDRDSNSAVVYDHHSRV